MAGMWIGGAALGLALLAGAAAAEAPGQAGRVQAALETWLADRGEIEGVTGIATYVSFGADGPAIEAFAGVTGHDPNDPPVGRDTLFHMGSTSKSFTSAVILKLAEAGKLTLDDTLGQWLPQYPAWDDVSIRRLLNMTSGIPNYSETEALSKAWVEESARDFTAEELVAFVYPDGVDDLPVSEGYHYSNTNFVLAGMIAAEAGEAPFRDLVHALVIEPAGLHETFFEVGTYPAPIVERLAHGYFENHACAEYQGEDCAETWNTPLIGRDIRGDSLSWAQAAGGGVATARDVDTWIREIFSGRFAKPAQQADWLSLVSTETGEPIDDVTPEDPRGFALGLSKAILAPYGGVWFYQGTTLGFRTLYVWFEDEDMMITVQTNSQPDDDKGELNAALIAVYDAVHAEP